MLQKKTKIILGSIVGVMAAISVTIGVFILVYIFKGSDVPYFFNHFGISIVLACVGVIAFILPIISSSKARYKDDSKDSIMVLVSGLCFLFALLTIILSYMGIGIYSSLA